MAHTPTGLRLGRSITVKCLLFVDDGLLPVAYGSTRFPAAGTGLDVVMAGNAPDLREIPRRLVIYNIEGHIACNRRRVQFV